MKTWKVWVDAGDNFTDCLALDKNGIEYRTKVLNSGCLRGKILEEVSEVTYRIDQSWGSIRNIFSEYEFHLLSGEGFSAKVKGFDALKQLVTISRRAPFNIVNCEFEITAHEEAPILAIRMVTQTSLFEEFPLIDICSGSTSGTLALLDRKGYNVLLITTTGFVAMPNIVEPHRSDLLNLTFQEDVIFFNSVIEVDEQISANGQIIKQLPESYINTILRQVFHQNPEVIVIAFQNSTINSVHEKIMANLLRAAGCKYVFASYELPQSIILLPCK